MKYSLSFEFQVTQTHTSHPRWWEFWKEPLVRESLIWQRFSEEIPEWKYEVLKSKDSIEEVEALVLEKSSVITPRIRNVQVEQVPDASDGYDQYIEIG